MTLIKYLAAAAAFTLIGSPALAQADGAAEVTMPNRATANVKGMVCDFCARAVTKVFGKEAEVETVTVDLDEGQIILTFKPGMTLSDQRIGELVKKSGYALVSVDRPVA